MELTTTQESQPISSDTSNTAKNISTKKPTYAVGIDLGTTYSCIAVARNNTVEVIASEIGERITPSYVAFSDEGLLVGQAAKNQAMENPENTIFDAKRLIGRSFNEPDVQRDMQLWPFTVVEQGGKPVFQIKHQNTTFYRSPEEISALILRKLKSIAEEYLGGEVTQAVITVPAYFNDSQRQSTKDAGTIAGLEVLRVINEPTAAAIAFGLGMNDATHAKDDMIVDAAAHTSHATEKISEETMPNPIYSLGKKATSDNEEERHVLVFDLGGGTFDVSLLEISGTYFSVLATAGDTHLGGEDFDSLLIRYFVQDFTRKNHTALLNHYAENGVFLDKVDPIQVSKDVTASALRRLRTAAERAKRMLSAQTSTSIEIEDFFHGIDLNTTLSRARFESLCYDYFERCLIPVKSVLNDSTLNKEDIHDIVLVGGSTRIPKVRQMLQDFFGKPCTTTINPDEAVAFGAAVQAQMLATDTANSPSDANTKTNDETGDDDEYNDEDPLVTLVDVAPLSLGIETVGNTMSTFISRNSSIPTSVTRSFSTDEDNQTEVFIRIFEGERPSTTDNHLLGVVVLSNIPKRPAGVPRITITLSLDQSGILSVSAIEEESKIACKTKITNEKGVGRLSKQELERLLGQTREYELADLKFRALKREKIEIQTIIQQVIGAVSILTGADATTITHANANPVVSADVNTNTNANTRYITEKVELQILTSLDDLQGWLQVNTDASLDEYTKKKVQFLKKMDSLLQPAFEEYIQDGGNPYPNGQVDGTGPNVNIITDNTPRG